MLIYELVILFLGSVRIHLHDLKFKNKNFIIMYFALLYVLTVKRSVLVHASLKPAFPKSPVSSDWSAGPLGCLDFNNQMHSPLSRSGLHLKVPSEVVCAIELQSVLNAFRRAFTPGLYTKLIANDGKPLKMKDCVYFCLCHHDPAEKYLPIRRDHCKIVLQ